MTFGKDQMRILPDSLREGQPSAAWGNQHVDGSRTSERAGHPTLCSTHRCGESVRPRARQKPRAESNEENMESENGVWRGCQHCGSSTALKRGTDISRHGISEQRRRSHRVPNTKMVEKDERIRLQTWDEWCFLSVGVRRRHCGAGKTSHRKHWSEWFWTSRKVSETKAWKQDVQKQTGARYTSYKAPWATAGDAQVAWTDKLIYARFARRHTTKCCAVCQWRHWHEHYGQIWQNNWHHGERIITDTAR